MLHISITTQALLLLAAMQAQAQKPGVSETVVVTATGLREELVDSVSLVTPLELPELRKSPALTLDDRLRRVPGFSLFRRSSSLVSHPTTQGASLRGIGPSGTSRSLVLLDGIPLNDPFGGWIYWNRLPTLALGSVEVARGAGSQLYGSSALGGTIQLLTVDASKDIFEFGGQVGNKETYDLEILGSDQVGDWSYLVSGRIFDTDGYFVVPEDLRGSVDEPADVTFQTFFGRVTYKDFFAGVNIYHEDRSNGTALQQNNSSLFLFETGINRSQWNWDFHIQPGVLESAFSRVLPDRSMEFPTAQQRFESLGIGSSFSYRITDRVTFGTDWRRASWDDNDQNFWGAFVQGLVPAHRRLDILLGVRFDVWENSQTQGEFNPRIGAVFRADDKVTIRGSAYRGFRAPTLNELYRPFRVGRIVTLANNQLGSESLFGGEGGLDYHPNDNLLVRLNGFYNVLDDPVGNVTLLVEPTLITRQRENLGEVDVKGFEAAVQGRKGPWSVRSGYLYSSSRVEETGLRLPQAPRHQVSAGVTWSGPLEAIAEGRYIASQFEDDLNQIKLGGYAVFDLSILKQIGSQWSLFFSLENILDREYPVGIDRIGAPRLLHGGVRFSLRDR